MNNYQDFDKPFLENYKVENGELLPTVFSGIFSKSPKIGKNKAQHRNESIQFLLKKYFHESISSNQKYLIIKNHIYLINQATKNQCVNLVNKIINEIIEKYDKDRKIQYKNGQSLSDEEILVAKSMLKTRFIQLLNSEYQGLITLQDSAHKDFDVDINSYKKYAITLVSQQTEFNEGLNFLYFYWEKRGFQFTFLEFLVSLYDKKLGKHNGLTDNDYACIEFTNNSFKDFIDLYQNKKRPDFNLKNLLITYLASQFHTNKATVWINSAKLTTAQIKNSKILDDRKKYSFYSEKSETYKSIFDTVVNLLKSSDSFSEYYKSLDANKYFISDFLVVREPINNTLSGLKELITKANQDNSKDNISQIFVEMDLLFYKQDFVPISLKQISPSRSSGIFNEAYVENYTVKNSLVKIINPPLDRSLIQKYENIDYDDYDKMLFNILQSKDIKSYLGKNFILENDFEYTMKRIGDKTRLLNFTFTIKTGDSNNDPGKKYRFSITPVAIEIAYEKTSSATGEGTIRKSSINYVLDEVYQMKSKLQQLVNLRTNNLPKNNNSEIFKEYEKVMNNKIILFLNADDKAFKDIAKSLIITNSDTPEDKSNKQVCINHLKGYCRKIGAIPPEVTLNNTKSLKKLFDKISAKEFGLFYDRKITISGEVASLELTETEKKVIILTEWGLITARGVFIFNNQRLNLAKETQKIEELNKYQMKMPALVKIGI